MSYTASVMLRNLSAAYGSEPILQNINLEFFPGELTAIIGPNGSGKSTLLKTIMGFIKPLSGEILFPSLGKNPRKKIAYIPQTDSVDTDFPISVKEVALMGRYASLGWIKRPGKAERNAAMKALEQVGMSEFASKQIGCLSGGQLQRSLLARALAQEAEIYFMDEPFKGIDAGTEESIFNILKQLRNSGKSIIAVHHDLSSVKKHFDTAVLLAKRVIASGTPGEVISPRNIELAYGISISAAEENH